MLWYKSWLETRWQFLIGRVVLMLSAAGTVIAYPKLMKLMPMVPTIDVSGELGRRIREAAELARSYRGYVWSQSFGQNLTQMATLFAALLGSGSPLAQRSRGAALFTLSLRALVSPELSRYSIFRVMSGEDYFRGRGLLWLGLLASAAVSVARLYVAAKNVARQDF